MPTYVYRCVEGHEFEEFQSIVAVPIEVCPLCGAHAERQISGGTGLIFKGSGFYITDYSKKSGESRSGSSASSKGADSTVKNTDGAAKSESKGEPKSEAKSESKSETKSESKSEKSSSGGSGGSS